MNIVGNVISGQVTGETAKNLSERFGKIMQIKESISINRTDTSVSKSGQLDAAIPPSRISALSSGEFVGMVADDPNMKIKIKMFYCEIINDVPKLKQEENNFKPIPELRKISQQEVMDNYFQIKMDVKNIVETEVARLKKERNEEMIQKKAKKQTRS